MLKKNQIGIGLTIICSALVFLTLKLDCNEVSEDIVRLKLKKKIISNSIKSLKAKEIIPAKKGPKLNPKTTGNP